MTVSRMIAHEAETIERAATEWIGSDANPDIGERASAAQLLTWGLLATAGMLFAGFASAYLVRREGADWQPIALPRILWLNTAVLFSSSVAVEMARAAWRKANFGVAAQWVRGSAILGMAFLIGQVIAWKELVAQGVYLPTNPYCSFFYVLTALHGVHLLGGIVGLAYLLWRVSQAGRRPVATSLLDSCATYWHFVDGVWVCLYLLLLFY